MSAKTDANSAPKNWQIRVRGLVQGVGFRPAVWRIAVDTGLQGEVLNDSSGVLIRLHCPRATADQFVQTLRDLAPPLSRIDTIDITKSDRLHNWSGFTIAASQTGPVHTGIVPDAATCPDCLTDIVSPDNRRFGYAFTNCTNCGPRLSITHAIPYDRANTAMAGFTMSPACQSEYDDPGNRRFHAQPNACPTCGPRLWISDQTGTPQHDNPITTAANLLQTGHILAIKGLGGFQLACDASNPDAVARLRRRKHRPAKPFALMARDLDQAETHVTLSPLARDTLCCAKAPIVLAPRTPQNSPLATAIAPAVAPGQSRLGFMLPNTPLHHLLMRALSGPIVLTSGNLSNEPQVIDNTEALSLLSGIADYWLMHDRDIVNRLDDSVVQITDHAAQPLRCARGYAPEPLQLHPGFATAPPVLAMGGDLKNTFCILKDGLAMVSQHMGDMQNAKTHADFRKNLALYHDIFDAQPQAIAGDAHPGYFATRLGQQHAAAQNLPFHAVQHHHAHIAALLAEHGYAPDCPPVLGVVLDGLGYGDDGTLWGGEFLLADFHSCQRLAHFAPIALPGGEKANQQPWRNTLAHLLAAFGPDALTTLERQYGPLDLFARLRAKPSDILSQMITRGVNAPLSSSAGRLFDAVAGALNLCFEQIEFEGQAAMQLQALAETEPGCTETYPETYTADMGETITWAPLWGNLLSDLQSGTPPAIIAAKFHNFLIDTVTNTALTLCQESNIIALSGGVFQNRILLDGVTRRLQSAGYTVLTPQTLPANDGGLSLGQAAIIAATCQHDYLAKNL